MDKIVVESSDLKSLELELCDGGIELVIKDGDSSNCITLGKYQVQDLVLKLSILSITKYK